MSYKLCAPTRRPKKLEVKAFRKLIHQRFFNQKLIRQT